MSLGMNEQVRCASYRVCRAHVNMYCDQPTHELVTITPSNTLQLAGRKIGQQSTRDSVHFSLALRWFLLLQTLDPTIAFPHPPFHQNLSMPI
jgi:hypothetical protein